MLRKAVHFFLNGPTEVWVYSWRATDNQYRERNVRRWKITTDKNKKN